MIYSGRKLVIATKHQKESVIAPVVEKTTGAICFPAVGLDTDLLGTFTGEVEREADPLTVARKKCTLAMELTGCDLAIASEGSFGAHPHLYFLPADEEILVLKDKANDLEVVVKELSTETNFMAHQVGTWEEVETFAKKAGFPEHGLIIRKSKEDFSEITKGIKDWKTLELAFSRFRTQQESVFVETDMRAMYNPTRMKVIEKATKKLVEKINSLCPNCETPGFGVTDAIKGLPCSLCGLPTRSILRVVYSCKKCSFERTEKNPQLKDKEDPMYCDHCNP